MTVEHIHYDQLGLSWEIPQGGAYDARPIWDDWAKLDEFIEKPIEVNIQRAEELVTYCTAKQVSLAVIYQNRFIVDIMTAHKKLQEKYIAVDGRKIRSVSYEADFSYYDKNHQSFLTVEDVKGMQTPVFRIKRKLFEYRIKPGTPFFHLKQV